MFTSGINIERVSAGGASKALEVFGLLDRPEPRDLDAGSQSSTLHGDESKRPRLGWHLASRELGAQRLGHDGAHRFPLGPGAPFEVRGQAVVKRDRRPHASHHAVNASAM